MWATLHNATSKNFSPASLWIWLLCAAKTRMHTSRMRTARFSDHLGGGGLPGECLPVGLSAGGRCLSRGMCTPLWTEWLTDRCKNITLPQTSFAGGKNSSASNSSTEIRMEGKIYLVWTVIKLGLWGCNLGCFIYQSFVRFTDMHNGSHSTMRWVFPPSQSSSFSESVTYMWYWL